MLKCLKKNSVIHDKIYLFTENKIWFIENNSRHKCIYNKTIANELAKLKMCWPNLNTPSHINISHTLSTTCYLDTVTRESQSMASA